MCESIAGSHYPQAGFNTLQRLLVSTSQSGCTFESIGWTVFNQKNQPTYTRLGIQFSNFPHGIFKNGRHSTLAPTRSFQRPAPNSHIWKLWPWNFGPKKKTFSGVLCKKIGMELRCHIFLVPRWYLDVPFSTDQWGLLLWCKKNTRIPGLFMSPLSAWGLQGVSNEYHITHVHVGNILL